MDRAFLTYYEAELAHIREMAVEFSALHPTVARNLSLESVPCPDPYVERLLEGVAYLAARTRLKVDAERARSVRGILDALYPDLAAPAPAHVHRWSCIRGRRSRPCWTAMWSSAERG